MISEIANTAGLSQRALSYKFKQQLGCTVGQYVRRARIEKMTCLLIDSEMSISNIADKMGFYTTDRFKKYFRKHKGINPAKIQRKRVS